MNKQPDLKIRKAALADLPQMFTLYQELQPDDPPVNEKMAAEVWEKSLDSGVTYFVGETNGTIVATCYVAIILNITRGCSPIAFIENIITAAAYRRLGIGKKLLESAIGYAKEQGCYKVTLQSNVKRTDAHMFYKSVGFDGNSKKAFEIRF
jgi:GNAT superfamily N-acetyltransferase